MAAEETNTSPEADLHMSRLQNALTSHKTRCTMRFESTAKVLLQA